MAHELYILALVDAVRAGKISLEDIEPCYRDEVKQVLDEASANEVIIDG